ncbi:MAG: peptidoglycan DD-metalloendopeptidase family protein [Clostridia bacterium]|nr:peptidoglycan DD-metalloendopeptidase family protein [Clostridia bacterium]
MEKREEQKRIEAPAKKAKLWVFVTAFLILLAALTYAGAKTRAGEYHAAARPEPEAEETETVTQAPTPEPTAAPTPEPTEEPTERPTQSYSKTAIVIGGNRVLVMASREAAEELIRNVQRHFEDMGNMPDNALTELVTKVEFEKAAAGDQTVSYDAAFALLTGRDTPLVFKSLATYFEDKTIPHTDRVVTDSYLPRGIRVVRVYGRDGIERETYSVVYINGVKTESRLEERYTVMEAINGDIRIGTRDFPQNFLVRPDYGSNPYEAMSLSFVPPCDGEITKLYGPYDGGFHHGVDISADAMSDVRAACSGTVVTVMERGAYGLMVEIEHKNGVCTRYARLGEAYVSVGDTVETGYIIGCVADDAEGPHLHFELRIRATAYNPLKILPDMYVKG